MICGNEYQINNAVCNEEVHRLVEVPKQSEPIRRAFLRSEGHWGEMRTKRSQEKPRNLLHVHLIAIEIGIIGRRATKEFNAQLTGVLIRLTQRG